MAETLILSNWEIADLITLPESIAAIEAAFADLGRFAAQELPRRRIYLPRDGETSNRYYWFNEKAGAIATIRTMAIRMDSATVEVVKKRGNARLTFPGAFSGLVLLFDTETNELLAIMQDFYLNPIRVAATTAVATKYLARDDARVMGLFGSGTQAALHLRAICEVLPLEEIRVYSTKPERRERFAAAMDRLVPAKVIPVDTPEQAVKGCDIVTTATNSNEPVFKGEWLEPGVHVNTAIGSDVFLPRRETDELTVLRSDLIVVNSKTSILLDKQPELYKPLREGTLKWEDIYELSDILIRRGIHGRSSAYQITYYNNNVGMGIQFAALGRIVYERAREQGRGTRIDGRLFMQYDDDLRAIRDKYFLGLGEEKEETPA